MNEPLTTTVYFDDIEIVTRPRRLLWAQSNAYDTVLLVEGNTVVGAWQVTDDVARNYLAATDLDEWEATYPDATSPIDYGEILDAGDARQRAQFYGGAL